MVGITNKAVDRLKILAKDSNNVELSVVGGGCSGMSYNFKFTDRKPNSEDKFMIMVI
jgi:Fe-S cluster assembly iron-binding protein IscA